MKSPAIPFTAHNIVLNDGTLTRPNSPITADEPVARAVMRSLDLFFPPLERKGKTIVDLGCLEGGYTVEFARAGFEAVSYTHLSSTKPAAQNSRQWRHRRWLCSTCMALMPGDHI